MKAISLNTKLNNYHLMPDITEFYNVFIKLVEYHKSDIIDYDTTSVNFIDLRISNSHGSQHLPIKDKELCLLLLDLKNAAIKGFDNSKQSGLNEGKNLLMQLQSGKITMDELNEKA